MTEEPPHPDHLDEAVRIRRERRERWQSERRRSIAENLSLIGALGWMIVVPTLLGIFLGRWLDHSFDTGIFWTLGLLFVGLVAGCTTAWQRMHRP